MHHLYFVGLPEPEKREAFELTCRLMDVERLAGRFGHALALHGWCEAEMRNLRQTNGIDQQKAGDYFRIQEQLFTWLDISRRDAAMTIWDFAAALALVRKTLDRTPTVKTLVDLRALENVLADFHKAFPNAKLTRNAAGHPIDVAGTPKRNAFSGRHQGQNIRIDSENLMMSGIDGDKAVVTIEGKILEFEFSAQTTEMLRTLCERTQNLFEPAVEKIKSNYFKILSSRFARPNE